MPDKYKALRDALAAGPTDGPWKVKLSDNATPHIFHGDDFAEIDECEKLVCVMPAEITRSYNSFANAKHIAAANPETIRNLLAERDRLLQACETALSYVEAVCFNTPNDKKRRNYADCAAKIRAAMGEDEGEPHD